MAVKNRQERYEALLKSIREYETNMILESIPKLKKQMTKCIRFFDTNLGKRCTDDTPLGTTSYTYTKKWQGKTLPKLRELWKQICTIQDKYKQTTIVPLDRFDDAQQIKKLFQKVRFELSGWTNYPLSQYVVVLSEKEVNVSKSKSDARVSKIESIDLMVVKYDTDSQGVFIRDETGELSFERIV